MVSVGIMVGVVLNFFGGVDNVYVVGRIVFGLSCELVVFFLFYFIFVMV